MGGGPATADVVRSSCFVTFPEQTHADPVPVDAWYLFAAGMTFLRRLARDRVGDKMPIALLLQEPIGENGERRYVSVSSNKVLQRALKETFHCPEKALILHVIDVGKVRGQKRIHVRPEVNPNVSPEPVEPLGLVFPTLSVDGIATPTAVEVPAVQVPSESLYDQMSRSMYNYRKDESIRWKEESSNKLLKQENPSWSQSACFVEEKDYTTNKWRKTEVDETKQSPRAVKAIDDALSSSSKPEKKCMDVKQADEHDLPVATIVESDTTQIPSDYVMLELQTGAGLPETRMANASSTYFISSRWAEQADEMSASMRLDRPPVPRATRVPASSTAVTPPPPTLDESFVLLTRNEL